MLHAQDRHAMEPHSCHRFPTTNDETDRPELKLVTFVGHTDKTPVYLSLAIVASTCVPLHLG